MQIENRIKVPSFPLMFCGSIPGSKSYANRLLILASLAKQTIDLNNVPQCLDVTELISALRTVGLIILENGNGRMTIENSFPQCELFTSENLIEIQTGEGGTTNRFLLAFLALGSKRYRLRPKGRIFQRPMTALIDQLKLLGVHITVNRDEGWIEIQGPLHASQPIEIDCSQTTQFYSAFKLALAFTKISVEARSAHASQRYMDLTDDLINLFKQGQQSFVVPLDFSSLSYPLVLASHSGSCLISNYQGLDQFQADSQLIPLLKKINVEYEETPQGLSVCSSSNKKRLLPFEWDVSTAPDLFPALCVLASFIPGQSIFYHTSVLHYKESDRLQEAMKLLTQFHRRCWWDEIQSTFTVEGHQKLSGPMKFIETSDDHRMVMMAYLLLRLNGGGYLSPALAVNKSFPSFFSLMGTENDLNRREMDFIEAEKSGLRT